MYKHYNCKEFYTFESQMLKKNLAAESLRGIACFIVLLSHLSLTFYPQLHNHFQQANFPSSNILYKIHNSPFCFFISGLGAVYVFFILSGFVLTASNSSNYDPKSKMINSILKRYPRLAIPALGSCLIAFIIFKISVDLSLTTTWFHDLIPNKTTFFGSIYSSLISPFIYAESSYNVVLWTMKNELIGSIAIFILIYFKSTFQLKKYYIFLLLFLLISLSISKVFFLGMFSFILGHFLYKIKNINAYLAIFLLIVGLYFIGFHKTSTSYHYIYSAMNYSKKTYDYTIFLGALFICISTLKSTFFSNLLSIRPLVKLGELSFSIYLIHLFILYIIGIPIMNFIYNFYNISFYFSAFISSSSTIIFTILVSFIFHKYIDVFSIKISNTFSNFIIKSVKE